ncbi:MAG: hypothetical protein V1661_02300 [bacterium]
MNAMQKTLIAIIILTIFGFVIFLFIIQPTIQDINAFNDRIQMEKVSLENKYTNRRNIKNIIADLKYTADNLAPLSEKIIIPKGREVEFISGLEAIAKKNNVAQKISLLPAPVAGSGNKIAEKQNLTIVLSGNYIDSLKYISELEKSDLYIIVSSVNIFSGSTEAGKANPAGIIKAYLEGYVYFSI